MTTLPIKSAHKTYLTVPNLDTAEHAFWLSRLVESEPNRLFVVLCQSTDELNRLDTELRFFGLCPFVFADWEILPYDRLSVHDEIVGERISLLNTMPNTGILLVAVQTAIARLSPPSWLLGQHFDLKVGGIFDRQKERERLIKAGYRLTDNVYAGGEFALRGSVVDIFVVGQALPFRLELFDDEIESIKFFNPDTQRTFDDSTLAKFAKENPLANLPKSAKVDKFVILPAKEFALNDGKENFRQNFATVFPDISHRKVPFYADVMNGIAPSGIEFFAPLFFDNCQMGALFDYLPDTAVLIYEKDLLNHHRHYWEQIESRYHNYRFDNEYPILEPKLLYLPENEFFGLIKPFAQFVFDNNENALPLLKVGKIESLPDLTIEHRASEPLNKLIHFCQNSQLPILMVAESAGRREILLELLKGKLELILVNDFNQFLNDKKNHQVYLSVSPIERGFILNDDNGFIIISEAQIFGRQIIQSRQKKSNSLSNAFLVKSVGELTEGNLVVHLEHGIGRYRGLVVMDAGGGEQEFIHLSYADDASIYVPITNLALIGKYAGVDSEVVALSKIGSGKWDKHKQKALTQIYDVAAELLNVQARRNAKVGIGFEISLPQYELFASGFAFEETLDQKNAILAIMDDMKQNKPMDRLICGDVGFGKTEVAMRAAFIAVQAGYQVAVLVPTTLLAGQHEDSFKTRFADFAIRVESLSRFVGKKAQDKVLADLAEGKVDIVIGTHRLLQDDVKFKNLGLMIIDEEHRFGVRHKERIKAMQSDVDSLSMTATPIPRTLNMALAGMQDISVIATPPARRLPIKTFVVEKNEQTTIDAILREILRGGQVYYLHNDVASINSVAEKLAELMPEVRVGVAHGQMNESELGAVMSEFYHKKTNVLVASTIIETGIDVPNANTIIINRADKFGLAQLHQLRGRVGRSHHQAYCYLFVPSIKGLTADAKRRLDAVVRANELGAGFILASEDLEIRGAGEILGKEQSGHIETIGFGLYMDMLARATKAIKEGKTPKLETPLDVISDVNLHASSLIPNDYLGDVSERLLFYKRIANCETDEELISIRTEMIDRFGAMPTPLANLFLVHKVRILANRLGISKVDVTDKVLSSEFRPDTPIDGLTIVKLLQSDDGYRMNGATGLKYQFKTEKTEVADRVEAVMGLLGYLQKGI